MLEFNFPVRVFRLSLWVTNYDASFNLSIDTSSDCADQEWSTCSKVRTEV